MGNPHKLLIIDDSTTTLNLLESFFSRKPYDVVTTTDGLDGLKLLEKEDFDLVITDLVLPNISGVGIISIIKKKYPDIPVVAITGWGQHPERLAAEAHADLVLGKPLKLSELGDLITDILSNKKTGPK